MRCDEARSRIEERQDGLLPEAEAAALDEHVRACRACANDVREAAAFESLLRHAADPGREDGVVERLSLALRVAHQEKRTRLVWIAAAAAIVLVGVVLFQLRDRAPDTLSPAEVAVLVRGDQVRVGRARLQAVSATQLEASRDGRTVRLDTGAVRFRVDPGETPFSVETPAGFVRVLGTEFEVRVMQKREWIGAGIITTVLVASGVVLIENSKGEVEARGGTVAVMREGHAPQLLDGEAVTALLEENEKLRAELDALRNAGPTLGGYGETPHAPSPTPKPKPAKREAEAPGTPEEKIAATIAETDWTRVAKALSAVLGGGGSYGSPTAEQRAQRAFLMSALAKLASHMNRRPGHDVLLDARVRRPFLEGLMRAALPGKDAKAQSAIIDRLDEALASADKANDAALLPSEAMAQRLAAVKRADDAVRRDLTSQENALVLRMLTLLQRGYGRLSTSTSTDVEGLSGSIQQSLVKRFKIESAYEDAVLPHAERWVAAHLQACREIEDTYRVNAHELVTRPQKSLKALGAERSQRGQLQTWERFARHQAAMERAIHDVMPAEVQERMRSAGLYWWFARLTGG